MEVMNRHIVYMKPGEGQTVEMPGKELMTRKVVAEQTGGAYSLFEIRIAPGDGLQPHIQHHEDECFYVLEGEFEFSTEDTRIGAIRGSLIYIPKGNLHAFRNAGGTNGRLLVLQTPGGAHERYVKEMGKPVDEPAGESVLNDGATTTNETRPVADPAALGAEYGIEIVPSSP